MLASIEYKRARGVPLSGTEQRLLDCAAIELEERRNTKFDYSDPNKIHVQRSINVEPIFETLKKFRHILKKDGMQSGRYLGSVDRYTAQNWANECGAAIGTQEYIEYAKKKLMSGEFSKFRMDWS